MCGVCVVCVGIQWVTGVCMCGVCRDAWVTGVCMCGVCRDAWVTVVCVYVWYVWYV